MCAKSGEDYGVVCKLAIRISDYGEEGNRGRVVRYFVSSLYSVSDKKKHRERQTDRERECYLSICSVWVL